MHFVQLFSSFDFMKCEGFTLSSSLCESCFLTSYNVEVVVPR